MATVGCAGMVVADMFCGPLAGLPQPGELLTTGDIPASAGGCAANVAIDLAKQGIAVDIACCVGTDVAAEMVVSDLGRANVGCRQVVRSPGWPTSKTVILVVAGQDRRYIHAFGANSAFGVGSIDRDWATSLKVFYLGGLFAMPGIATTELAGLLAACRAAGVTTVVDVVVPREPQSFAALDALLPHIDWFLPNADEARAFTGHEDPLEQIAALGARGARGIIVTHGGGGSVATDGTRRWRAEACTCEAVDPSGSGDAFAAGIITGLTRGWALPQTLRYASALGASAARAVGTTGSVFDAAEAEAFVAAHPTEVREIPWN